MPPPRRDDPPPPRASRARRTSASSSPRGFPHRRRRRRSHPRFPTLASRRRLTRCVHDSLPAPPDGGIARDGLAAISGTAPPHLKRRHDARSRCARARNRGHGSPPIVGAGHRWIARRPWSRSPDSSCSSTARALSAGRFEAARLARRRPHRILVPLPWLATQASLCAAFRRPLSLASSTHGRGPCRRPAEHELRSLALRVGVPGTVRWVGHGGLRARAGPRSCSSSGIKLAQIASEWRALGVRRESSSVPSRRRRTALAAVAFIVVVAACNSNACSFVDPSVRRGTISGR